jgi:hypothetical protein
MRLRLRLLWWRRRRKRSGEAMERDTLPEPAARAWEQDSEPGEYLTDGFRLYRMVVLRLVGEERLVELEDCRTLDIWLVSADELESLRPVRPQAQLRAVEIRPHAGQRRDRDGDP